MAGQRERVVVVGRRGDERGNSCAFVRDSTADRAGHGNFTSCHLQLGSLQTNHSLACECYISCSLSHTTAIKS